MTKMHPRHKQISTRFSKRKSTRFKNKSSDLQNITNISMKNLIHKNRIIKRYIGPLNFKLIEEIEGYIK